MDASNRNSQSRSCRNCGIRILLDRTDQHRGDSTGTPQCDGTGILCLRTYVGVGETRRAILISATNLGKEPTTIESIVILSNSPNRSIMMAAHPKALLSGSSVLPHRLETHSSASFNIDVESLPRNRVLVLLFLSHGTNLEAVVSLDGLGGDRIEAVPSKRDSIGNDTIY
jgi:hypothetical protein